MPKKLDTKTVKNLYNKYGYTLPDDFIHINTTKYMVVPYQIFLANGQ